jgi:hypothetical protein
MKITISKDISLPPEVVTQTIAILAKRRAGKSYAMRRFAEQLLEAQQQVVIIDPKGDQWGIRSSADGKKAGYSVLILGGEHGDLPLESGAGEMVARLVVEEQVSVLLDLSAFRKTEIATFMAIFLETLYRLKAQEKYRTPMTLIVDEADAIAPQKPQANEARMLGAIDDIVRRGGQRGIGCCLVSQRSAVLNKNVLTQAQMLVVLRTIAPQDIAAMKAWIEVHGSMEEGREMIEALPSLPVGDAYFWSPGWPTEKGIFKRSHVLPITTFDSGATPAVGQKRVVPKKVADIDLEALRGQMAETIERQKQNDPKALKAEVAMLRSQLEDALRQQGAYTPEDLKKEIDRAVRAALHKAGLEWGAVVKSWANYANRLKELLNPEKAGNEPVSLIPMGWLTPSNLEETRINPKRQAAGPAFVPPAPMPDNEPLQIGVISGAPGKLLDALVADYPEMMSRKKAAAVAGIKPRTSTFRNAISILKTRGLIYVQGDGLSATSEGVEASDVRPGDKLAGAALQEKWRGELPKSAIPMFNEVLRYPNGITRKLLADYLGMSPAVSTFRNILSTLRVRGLVETDGEIIRPSEHLL